MSNIGTLIVGVLVVIAVVMITAAIMALAPYVAGAIVILGLCWFYLRPAK